MALTLQKGRLQFGQMKQDAQGCWLAGHEANILTQDLSTQARVIHFGEAGGARHREFYL